MTDSKKYSIVGGPSKWDLSVALFDCEVQNPRKVYFTANTPLTTQIKVSVNSVQAKDGSGEAWNIEGYVTEIKRGKEAIQYYPLPSLASRVFIYFRTDKRTGHIRFFGQNN